VPDAAGVKGAGEGAGLTATPLAVELTWWWGAAAGLMEDEGDGPWKSTRAAARRDTGTDAPGTSFSSSLRDFGGPPCSADIC
jgi:hypothetical protein